MLINKNVVARNMKVDTNINNNKANSMYAKTKIAARTKSHAKCANQVSIVIPIDWAFSLFCEVITTMIMIAVTSKMLDPKYTVIINVISPPKNHAKGSKGLGAAPNAALT